MQWMPTPPKRHRSVEVVEPAFMRLIGERILDKFELTTGINFSQKARYESQAGLESACLRQLSCKLAAGPV